MTEPGRLADYLRARRARLRPEDVGLARGEGTRRVAGLRREEVAILAGISTEYYLRLEQGRDANPSGQVLDALARALRLDPVATTYLHALARPAAGAAPERDGDTVLESIRGLIDSWPSTAAMIHSRYVDVLASNSLARALNPNYRAGVNGVLSLFLDPAERQFHVGWEGLAARSAALLRNLADTPGRDARLDALVEEGSARSPLFRELWERRDVVRVSDGTHVLRHPRVGELTLNYQRLPIPGTGGQSLFLYFAAPGTPSAVALRRLGDAG